MPLTPNARPKSKPLATLLRLATGVPLLAPKITMAAAPATTMAVNPAAIVKTADPIRPLAPTIAATAIKKITPAVIPRKNRFPLSIRIFSAFCNNFLSLSNKTICVTSPIIPVIAAAKSNFGPIKNAPNGKVIINTTNISAEIYGA